MTKIEKITTKDWAYLGDVKNGKPHGFGKKNFYENLAEKILDKKVKLSDKEFNTSFCDSGLDYFSQYVRGSEEGHYREGKLHGLCKIEIKQIEIIQEEFKLNEEGFLSEGWSQLHAIFNRGIPNGNALLYGPEYSSMTSKDHLNPKSINYVSFYYGSLYSFVNDLEFDSSQVIDASNDLENFKLSQIENEPSTSDEVVKRLKEVEKKMR